MRTIIISGTPGTGKSALAKKLAKYLSARLLNVQQIILKHHLQQSYDQQRDTYEIDTHQLNKVLISFIITSIQQQKKAATKRTKYLIIESHLSHYLPAKYVNLCIITTCDLKTLHKRLTKRNYSKAKVQENSDAEIFDICYTEAAQKHKNILKVDTSKGINLNTLKQIKQHLKRG